MPDSTASTSLFCARAARRITINGNYLTSAQSGNGLSLGEYNGELSQWYLSSNGNSKFKVISTGAKYNGYSVALEYYRNSFMTYRSGNSDAFSFELFTHLHSWNGGVAVQANSDYAILTVTYDDAANFYLTDKNGSYLTAGATGSSLTLEATANDYSLWYLDEHNGSQLIVNKNATYRNDPIAVEYYGGNFYTWSWRGDYSNSPELFCVELYTRAAARNLTATYSLSANATIKINLQIAGLEAGDVVKLDGEVLRGENGVYSCDVAAKNVDDEFVLTARNANGEALLLNGRASLPVSVRAYVTAEAADTTVGQDGNTTVADVVKTMGNYGEYAKKYFTERDAGTTYGEYLYVDVKLAAKDLDKLNRVEVVYNGVHASVEGYSALRYAARTVADANADPNLVALCKALFLYYKAANGYFAES